MAMPVFETVEYSDHATRQMRTRRIAKQQVELVLRIGEGGPGEDEGTWGYQLGFIRVIVVEYEHLARIVTAIRLPGEK
jgi:hypothetical protein